MKRDRITMGLFVIIAAVCAAAFVGCQRTVEPTMFDVCYTAGAGGYIYGEAEQRVAENGDGTEVRAVSESGYVFVKWSDGSTELIRQDKNVTSDIAVTAEFAPLGVYTLTFEATAGGRVVGETVQTVVMNHDGTPVTAIADDGYRFVKWSDGSRQEQLIPTCITNSFTFTAIFVRIPVYTLTYTINKEYGYIDGETTQTMLYGESGTPVTAITTNENYEFVCWSDGYENPTRTDTNIRYDREFRALYRQTHVTYTYDLPYMHGSLIGESIQRVRFGEAGTPVTAVPEEGYAFLGWTDGVKEATRVDDKKYDIFAYPIFEKILYAEYRVNNEAGGRIVGESSQTVYFNHDAQPVTAVAADGWIFICWADGSTDTERHETKLTDDFSSTAFFEPIEKVFTYDYCGATSETGVNSVRVSRAAPQDSKFVVPQKTGYEFVGWYADKDYAVRVTDENGGLMYGYNTVTLETDTLYARWLDPDAETLPVYKILIVIVDEIDATLSLRTDHTQKKRLQHKITALERVLCKQVAGRMSDYLNSWFAGKVKFEIDTFFTMQPVDTEDFYYDNNFLDVLRMKEVKHLYYKYESMLTLFDMDDFDHDFREPRVAGLGTYKSGSVYLDEAFSYLLHSGIADKVLRCDESVEKKWYNLMDTCLHEFTHTIEAEYPYDKYYDFDEAISKLWHSGVFNLIEITRRYLVFEAEIDGEFVGIPPDYWQRRLNGM